LENPYPEESQKLDVVGHLEELRKRVLLCLCILAAMTVFLFWRTADLMRFATKPLGALAEELIFISPTEVFTSYIKLALLAALILSVPVVLYETWAFIAPAVSRTLRRNVLVWLGFSLVLFAAGVLFAYFILIPLALDFLLNFGRDFAAPHITISKYISFFVALILSGGVVFQIPVVMGLLADVGILQTGWLKQMRQYAIVIILIVAAIITPTADIVNMIIFAVPMTVLYELGILVARWVERCKARGKE
jgi:sec-independent protein translocase protein TatC